MSAQLWALAVAGAVVVAAACLETFRARRARKLVLATSTPALRATSPQVGRNEEPYILYFTGDSCTVCRTHQEPALARLSDVRIDKIDAVNERALADQFHVYTLPTTVVMAADGQPLHVNYGYAPAPKLERQLAEARGAGLRSAATA
ncbi:MAG TPA: thioredoxin family protein [Candidatus Dormibacteraeota bacterium]|nr:thioredoxin family protein [Candidatus Dormibacteraeota bacterium]